MIPESPIETFNLLSPDDQEKCMLDLHTLGHWMIRTKSDGTVERVAPSDWMAG